MFIFEIHLRDLIPESFGNYSKITLREMSLLNPDFNWVKYVRKTLENTESEASVDADTEVFTYYAEYLRKFTSVLKSYDNK